MALEHLCFKLTHDTEVPLYFSITSAAGPRVGQLRLNPDLVRSCFRRCDPCLLVLLSENLICDFACEVDSSGCVFCHH